MSLWPKDLCDRRRKLQLDLGYLHCDVAERANHEIGARIIRTAQSLVLMADDEDAAGHAANAIRKLLPHLDKLDRERIARAAGEAT